jgi:hypothetical protein
MKAEQAHIIDAGDSVRIRSGRHEGKTGIVKKRVVSSKRPTEYYVFVPADNDIYYYTERQLEKIEQQSSDTPSEAK